MQLLENKETITSLELVKQINIFREEEYNYKIQNGLELGKVEARNGHYTELLHQDLLNIIRDEFEEEIADRKISVSEYKDSTNRSLPMFELTLEQAKQVLIRESKYVRKAILEYIKKLEQLVMDLKNGITEKDRLLLNMYYAKNDEERTIAVKKYEEYIARPLLEDNRKQKEIIEHKQEVIEGLTNSITIYEKRQLLNRVVRYKGADYRQRWTELYKVFKETHHIDLKARMEGYNKINKPKIKSTLEYAEKFGFINDLYSIACKLYESDMNELIDNLKDVISNEEN
jgi:hypothetical protein